MGSNNKKYWLVVTSPENFKHDREELNFKTQGLPDRNKKQVKKMEPGDRVIYYIAELQKFGATATITGTYYHEETKLWTDEDRIWPARCPSEPDIVLEDDELVDAKKLVPDMNFIENEQYWGAYFQGSIKQIPEEDFKLIESEMKKIISSRIDEEETGIRSEELKDEEDYRNAIEELNLQSSSVHDRIGEMLEQIGTWMDYNSQTRFKITPDHAYELDVAWLKGKNPEIAFEVQIGGNITEAKDRLSQARKFNYRKVIMVLKEDDLSRLNRIMKHEPELRNWMDVWSIGTVYEMYKAGEKFFKYYKILKDSSYKEKTELELV